MRKIKVAFTSIFYPLFMGRYILDALLRRDDVEVWTAGPYSGRWIPWMGGINCPEEYVFTPDMPLPYNRHGQNLVNYMTLQKEMPFQPDLWLEVNSTLGTIGRPAGGLYAIVGTDPHVLDYSKQRADADVFFCMQKPYMKSGDFWLPYGYDPVWHSQTEIPIGEREIDCSLIGLQYGHRAKLFDRLRRPNKHPRRGGAGFVCRFETGPSYGDARAIYHNTVVGINWASLQDTTARVFELMAFGIVPVLNRVPDLMEMFVDGTDFLGFDTEDEAVTLIHKCLDDLDFADQLGKQAREAVEPHSWDERVKTILESAGLL